MVRGALDPITVIRNGVQGAISGEELAQMVNRASDNVPMWVPDEFADNSDMDSPWSSWLEGEENRAYRSPYADDAAWPKSMIRRMWTSLAAAWKNVGDADQVFAAMVGAECELSEDEQRVLVLLQNLADALLEPPQLAFICVVVADKVPIVRRMSGGRSRSISQKSWTVRGFILGQSPHLP